MSENSVQLQLLRLNWEKAAKDGDAGAADAESRCINAKAASLTAW